MFADPSGSHLDAWGLILVAAGCFSLGVGVLWTWELRRLWRHHPYRIGIQAHLRDAAVSAAVFLGIAAGAHVAGWPVWGRPAFGGVGVVLLVGTGLVWRFGFLPALRRFEARHPELTAPRARLPRADRRAVIMPALITMAAAPGAYLIFLGHAFPHPYHEGMYFIGPLVGLVIGSLVATQTADVVRLEREARRMQARARKKKR